MTARRARIVGWLGGLAATALVLHLASSGELAPPPATPGGVLAWIDERSPLVAGLGLLRLGAELTAWYLLAVSAVRVATMFARGARPAHVVDLVTPPLLRRVMAAGLGLGVVAAPVLPAGAGTRAPAGVVSVSDHDAPGGPSAGSATMRPATATTATTATTDRVPGTATMRPVLAPAAVPPRPSPAAVAPSTWTVEAGECFWSIAADILAEHLGRPGSTAEVADYWQRLIEVNRSRLVEPDDPDLLLPGQVLEVPDPLTAT